MEALNGIPIIAFETPAEWEAWLRDHHTEPTGLWLKIAKKASGITSITYAEALEEALCHGWIDGQKRSLDDQYFLQKFTPRRPKSLWSRINVAKVAQLENEGRMKPNGKAEVEAAKLDGRWEKAYDSHSTSTVPTDFEAVLKAHPKAKAFFETLNKTNTYAVLWRIQTAKTPATRQARIEKILVMLEKGEKFH